MPNVVLRVPLHTEGTTPQQMFDDLKADMADLESMWINFRGAYNASTAYVIGDGVTTSDGMYRAKVNTTGNAPVAGGDATWDEIVHKGPAGDGVDHTTRTAGTGAPGTTDTYTMWGDAGETINMGTFDVYNGLDGAGTGDMVKATYDPTNIAADVYARANHTGTQLMSTISDAGTAATKNVPATGDAAATEVVLGNDSRLTSGGASQTDVDRNSTNIMVNAFQIAVNGTLSVQQMVDAFVDTYSDETGVDTANSVNQNYDATNDLYTNAGTAAYVTGDRTATVTVSTTLALNPTYNTISNLVDGSFTGDAAGSISWNASQAVAGLVILFDFGAGNSKTIDEAKFYQNGAEAHGVWKWQGSADNITYTDIGGTFTLAGSTGGTTQTTLNGNTTAYRYYRLLGVSGSTNALARFQEEFEFRETPATTNMTLLSNSYTAVAQPTTGIITLNEEDVDAITLNTDMIAYVTRDRLATTPTYAVVTLANKSANTSGARILQGSADLSALPAGTDMGYKLVTANTKGLKIHSTGLSWK